MFVIAKLEEIRHSFQFIHTSLFSPNDSENYEDVNKDVSNLIKKNDCINFSHTIQTSKGRRFEPNT